MNILTVDNVTYDLNAVPNEVDDLQYCVLDCTNPKSLDYFYIPLIFLESFNAPAVILDIGGKQIEMPMDWSILIGEKELGLCEMIPLTSLNDRGFDGNGNYTLGVKEQIIFPEITIDKINKVTGMNITIVIDSNSDKDSFELLKAFGMPFISRN